MPRHSSTAPPASATTSRARRVAANSRAALASLPIARCQRQVVDAITELCREGWRPSDQDTAAYLGWPINCITGRRNELVQAGVVVKGGDKRAETGRRVAWWRPSPRQLDLFAGARRS